VVVGLLTLGQIGCSSAVRGSGGTRGSEPKGAGGRPAAHAPRAQIVRAKQALAARQYVEAIRLCDALISADARDAEAYKIRGFARMALPDFGVHSMGYVDLQWAETYGGGDDPVVWYLRSVHSAETGMMVLDQARYRALSQAMSELQQAEKLDPANPAYARARELLVPQLYFAKRDVGLDDAPYTGRYADVVRFGDKLPYGEVAKMMGWLPAAEDPAPAPAPAPAPETDGDPTMYVLLGIGAALVLAGLDDRADGAAGPSAGDATPAVVSCVSCRGTGKVDDYDYYLKRPVKRWCGLCHGSGVRPR
jgi:hypothetical protein